MADEREELARWEAFEKWAQTISIRILKCRTSGHRFPDWDDNRRTRVTRRRNGSYIIHAPCARRCGVVLTRFVDRDGYLERSNKLTLDYSEAHSADRDPDKAYLMPKAARSGGKGYTRDQRAYLRRELLERLAEWITEED